MTKMQLTALRRTLGQIQGLLDGPALVLDFFLQQSDGVDELLGTRRTSGNINIDGNHLVDALYCICGCL